MLRLLVKCAVFALPLVVGFALLERGLSGISNSYTHKRAILERDAEAADVVVLGSSREYFGVDPARFPCGGLNLANTSQSLAIDAAIVRAYLPRMKRLELLVLPVSLFSFDNRLTHSPEAWRFPLFTRAFGLEVPGEDAPGLLEGTLFRSYGPKQSLRFALRGFRGDPDETDERGWLPSKAVSEISPKAGQARAQYHLSVMDPAFRATNVGLLLATIRAGQAAGARVVLLVTPALRTYLDALPDVLEDFRATLRDVSRQTGATVADYLEDPRFTERDFGDNDHLSPAGARRFSELFAAEYVAPAVSCRPAVSASGGSPP